MIRSSIEPTHAVDRLVTGPALADVLGVSSTTIGRLRKAKIIRGIYVGNRLVRYDVAECIRALKDRSPR